MKLFLVQRTDGLYLCKTEGEADGGGGFMYKYTDYFFGGENDVSDFVLFASEEDAVSLISREAEIPKDCKVIAFGLVG